jgi:hypothetical protein
VVAQLTQLRNVAIARMENYRKPPPYRTGAFWQEKELNKLGLVRSCIAVNSCGNILDAENGKWIYCRMCRRAIVCKDFSATQFLAHKCCTQVTAGASVKGLLHFGFRGLKRGASNQSMSSHGSAAMSEQSGQQSITASVETHGADRCMGVPMVKYAKYFTLPSDIAFILQVPEGQRHPPVEMFAEAANVVMELSAHR